MKLLGVWTNLEILRQWQSTELPAEEAEDFDRLPTESFWNTEDFYSCKYSSLTVGLACPWKESTTAF